RLALQRREAIRAERDTVGELARSARRAADPALERAELLVGRVEVARRRFVAPGRERAEQRGPALLGELGAPGREIGATGADLTLGVPESRRERARALAGTPETLAHQVELARERSAREQRGIAGRPRGAPYHAHAGLGRERARELVERVEPVDGAQRSVSASLAHRMVFARLRLAARN